MEHQGDGGGECVVTAEALAAGDARWVRVAARLLLHLGTVSKARRARRRGELLLNGSSEVPETVAARVGDVLRYTPQVTAPSDEDARWAQQCARLGLRAVFEDAAVAVVLKPAGVHVKGRGPRSVERALPSLLAASGRGDALQRPQAVHRLDARVGGLLLVAKARGAEAALCRQLERHHVAKRYRAILAGSARRLEAREEVRVFEAGKEVAELPIELLEEASRADGPPVMLVRGDIDGRACVTAVRVVEVSRSARYEWISTVDLWPLTGRKHQLRIHMARLGLPIVGDDLHHGEEIPPVVKGLGLFLFAVGIAFNDGWDADDGENEGNRRRFEIAEPPKFERFRHFCALNWDKLQQKRARGLPVE